MVVHILPPLTRFNIGVVLNRERIEIMRKKILIVAVTIAIITCTVYVVQLKTYTSPISPEYSHATAAPTLILNTSLAQSITPPASLSTMSEHQYSKQCVKIHSEIPLGIYDGSIVLGGHLGDASYLLDLPTLTLAVLEGGNSLIYESVSPDNVWMAYYDYDVNKELVVLEIATSKRITIPLEEEWFRLDGWLDNQHLIISLMGEKKGYLLINPFSGKRTMLLDDFPDVSSSVYGPASWWGSAKYNASLTHVVYPRIDSYIVLWDRLSHREVASFWSVGEPFAKIPLWSPDGNKFVVALKLMGPNGEHLPEELFIITINGERTQLTKLGNIIEGEFDGYSWSPDGNSVAFWIRSDVARLAALNIKTLKVTEYCVIGDLHEPPIWSPDSRHLVVTALDDESKRATFLVDLNGLNAYRIADYFRLGGWLKHP